VSGISGIDATMKPTLESTPLLEYPTPALERPAYRPHSCYRSIHDPLPEAPPAPLPEENKNDLGPAASSHIRRLILRVNPIPEPYTTPLDSFGRYRVYTRKPLSIPDSICELEDVSDVCNSLNQNSNSPTLAERRPILDIIHPCPNFSAFLLEYWYWIEGLQKSQEDRDLLVRNVITRPGFIPSEVAGINWCHLDDKLSAHSESPTTGSGWQNLSIPLSLPPRTPSAASLYKSEPVVNTFVVPNVPCRKLTEVVRDAFTKNNVPHFHYEAFKSYWKDPKSSQTHRSYGEVFESQRMIDAQQAVQDIILDEPCRLPRCVAAIMIFSDAMQLSNFGNAKAWPIRVTFGNLSKYERCKPNSGAHYEVGFMPTVSKIIYSYQIYILLK
jgi:hypothetical protein